MFGAGRALLISLLVFALAVWLALSFTGRWRPNSPIKIAAVDSLERLSDRSTVRMSPEGLRVRVLDGHGNLLRGSDVSFEYMGEQIAAVWSNTENAHRVVVPIGSSVVANSGEWGTAQGRLDSDGLNVIAFRTGGLVVTWQESLENHVQSLSLVRIGTTETSVALPMPNQVAQAVIWRVEESDLCPGHYELVCIAEQSYLRRDIHIEAGITKEVHLNLSETQASFVGDLVLHGQLFSSRGHLVANERISFRMQYQTGAWMDGEVSTERDGHFYIDAQVAARGSALYLSHVEHQIATVPIDAPAGGVVDCGLVTLRAFDPRTVVAVIDAGGHGIPFASVWFEGQEREFRTNGLGEIVVGLEKGHYSAMLKTVVPSGRRLWPNESLVLDGSGVGVIQLGNDLSPIWVVGERSGGQPLESELVVFVRSGTPSRWNPIFGQSRNGKAWIGGIDWSMESPVRVLTYTEDSEGIFAGVALLDPNQVTLTQDGQREVKVLLERWDRGTVTMVAGVESEKAIKSSWESIRMAPEWSEFAELAEQHPPLWIKRRGQYYIMRLPYVEDGVIRIETRGGTWSRRITYHDLIEFEGEVIVLENGQ